MAVNTGNENAPNSAMAQALAAAKITPQAAQPTNPTRPTAKTTASIFDMNNDLNPLMARNTVDAAWHDIECISTRTVNCHRYGY